MAFVRRLVIAAFLSAGLAGCGSLAEFDVTGSVPAASPAPSGYVYIFRGIGGRMATLDLDELGDKISRTGVKASTYNFSDWVQPADQAIRRYKQAASRAPIILMGHSAGGDAAIAFAHRLKQADVPVSLIVTFDPTRAAGQVPSNVERYVNIYQSTNFFGGGAVQPAADFRGHFATVNLKRYWNVLHVNMLKIGGLQDRVMAKVAQVTSLPARLDAPSVAIEYVMPREYPIEIWDSGTVVVAEPGDSVRTIAQKYGAPAWIVAQLNNLGGDSALRQGQKVIVPRHLEDPRQPLPDPLPPAVTSLAPMQ